MTDHPFDEIAIGEAIKAFLDEGGMWASDFQKMNAALTAACKSMKERGKAETGYGRIIDYDENFYEWQASSSEPHDKTGRFPVTIFRHGE